MALQENEVRDQLKRMVSFIVKEAEEKAHEIRDKAEEEFSMEKQRIVQADKLKIMKDYERREKQEEILKKIAYSNALNQSRLKVLKSREDSVARLLSEAQKTLSDIGKPGEKYKNLLGLLILQGLLKLLESNVAIRCRECDQDFVKEVMVPAAQGYKKKTGKDVNLTIDSVFLPPPPKADGTSIEFCSGGVVLVGGEGRILCHNTLDSRLTLAFEQRLHDIRKTLFGKSLTRKYEN